MTERIVVGLFQSKGEAEDACGRLRTEGVAASELALLVLHDTAPLPDAVQAEVAGLTFGPLLHGDVRKAFVQYIHNGETAVCVRTQTAAAIQFALDVMKLYGPVALEVLPLQIAAAALQAERASDPPSR